MAISKIEINTDALNHDIDEIADSLSVLQEQVQNMYDEVAELNTMWKGQANRAFNEQYNKDCNAMLEILLDINKYVDSLKSASKTYVQCENSVGDVVRSLRI